MSTYLNLAGTAVLILANAAAVTLETDDAFHATYERELFFFELISIAIFLSTAAAIT